MSKNKINLKDYRFPYYKNNLIRDYVYANNSMHKKIAKTELDILKMSYLDDEKVIKDIVMKEIRIFTKVSFRFMGWCSMTSPEYIEIAKKYPFPGNYLIKKENVKGLENLNYDLLGKYNEAQLTQDKDTKKMKFGYVYSNVLTVDTVAENKAQILDSIIKHFYSSSIYGKAIIRKDFIMGTLIDYIHKHGYTKESINLSCEYKKYEYKMMLSLVNKIFLPILDKLTPEQIYNIVKTMEHGDVFLDEETDDFIFFVNPNILVTKHPDEIPFEDCDIELIVDLFKTYRRILNKLGMAFGRYATQEKYHAPYDYDMIIEKYVKTDRSFQDTIMKLGIEIKPSELTENSKENVKIGKKHEKWIKKEAERCMKTGDWPWKKAETEI